VSLDGEEVADHPDDRLPGGEAELPPDAIAPRRPRERARVDTVVDRHEGRGSDAEGVGEESLDVAGHGHHPERAPGDEAVGDPPVDPLRVIPLAVHGRDERHAGHLRNRGAVGVHRELVRVEEPDVPLSHQAPAAADPGRVERARERQRHHGELPAAQLLVEPALAPGDHEGAPAGGIEPVDQAEEHPLRAARVRRLHHVEDRRRRRGPSGRDALDWLGPDREAHAAPVSK
jgi:hypothetical protein